MNFKTCIESCVLHPVLYKTIPSFFRGQLCFLPPAPGNQPVFCPYIPPFSEYQMNGWFLCLLSVSEICLIIMPLVVWVNHSFFYPKIVFHCMAFPQFINYPIEGHLDCFKFWLLWIKLHSTFSYRFSANINFQISWINT